MKVSRRLAAVAALWALGVLGPDAATAAKPGGGGTIYFLTTGQAPVPLWTMASDGTGKVALPSGVTGEPSTLLHAGHRWFVRTLGVGGTYPDGSPRREFFALRGDGAASVQLTFDPAVECIGQHSASAAGILGASPRWAKDDTFFSFAAIDWSGGAPPVSRLLVVPLAYDASGAPAPSGPTSSVVTLPYTNGSTFLSPSLWEHDWSPDGTRVAWTEQDRRVTPTQLTAHVTVVGGATTTLAAGRVVTSWSSTDRLLLGDNATLVEAIDPDGADRVVLAAGSTRGGSTVSVSPGHWSPTGSHVTYLRWDGSLVRDIYRATSTGGSKTNLTADLSGSTGGGVWR